MKLRQMIVSLFVASFFIACLPARVMATSQDARDTALAAALLLAAAGYEVEDGDCGFLSEDDSEIYRMTLYRGNEYAFIAGGCYDAYDIDLYLYDEDGDLIAKDSSSDKVAILEGRPPWTGTFYIKLVMYDSTSNGAHWCMMIGSK